MLVRRLRSVLQSASVAPFLSPFSPLRLHQQVTRRLFPLAVRPRALRWRAGLGGRRATCWLGVRFVLSVRPTLRRPPYAPLSSSFLAGVLQASRSSLFPLAVIARGRCRPPIGRLRYGLYYERGWCRLLSSPLSCRQGGAAASALSPSGTLTRCIRSDFA